MKNLLTLLLLSILCSFQISAQTVNLIPASDPRIQYYGRWDFTVPSAPTHSWPGGYIYAEFEGTSIGVRTDDNFSYYNVFIDGALQNIFHGNKSGINNYTLASGLTNGKHTILYTMRNETSWTKFAFNGFILDEGKTLLTPATPPVRKIEFIGDSYTCAAGNLWKDNTAAPSGDYTDIYQGFASIVARNFNAQYYVSGRSGYGMVQDYLGNVTGNLPDCYDRTLVYTEFPKWDFSKWTPNLVVICLGLNDFSGWNGYSQTISQENSNRFKQKYHEFIGRIMDYYPGVRILCVAANDLTWIKKNVSEVVTEQRDMGNKNVNYTYFLSYSFVNSGHPDVEGHKKIADRLIATIDTINAWTPYVGTGAPKFVKVPDNPTTVTTTNYILNVKTDKYARVRYSTQNKPYDQMENEFTTTGTREHSTNLKVKQKEQYTFYLRAVDIQGNKMDTSAVVKFTVDTTKVLYSWKQFGYNLSAWKKGRAPLGNDGAATNNTKISNAATVYFRQEVTINSVKGIKDLHTFINGHDGAVIYMNGVEVGRINMDVNSEIGYNSFATAKKTLGNRVDFLASALSLLKEGKNVFAFEMHSAQSSTPSISFDGSIYDYAHASDFYSLESDWYYYDAGKTPADQLQDKTTGIESELSVKLPTEIKLNQNYPNPFNPETQISYQLPAGSHVSLKIFDLLGREVVTLIDEMKSAGTYSYQLSTNNLPLTSGIYFYTLKAGNFSQTRKMVLLK